MEHGSGDLRRFFNLDLAFQIVQNGFYVSMKWVKTALKRFLT